MKKLKIILSAIALLGLIGIGNAQKIARGKPVKGAVIVKLDNPTKLKWKGKTYYYARGNWHKKSRGKYLVCQGPVIRKLPARAVMISHGGRKMFSYAGRYYVPYGRHYRLTII